MQNSKECIRKVRSQIPLLFLTLKVGNPG